MGKKKLLDMTLIALFAALIAVCAWISVPFGQISFTLQTFAVFLAVGLLGGRRGTLAVAVYLAIGALGVPVFTGFRGGVGALAASTGGYLVGFLFSALLMWLLTSCLGEKLLVLALAMAAGLLLCYTFGTVWFQVVYTRGGGAASLWTVLSWCVFPYLLPDAAKLALALLLTARLRRFVPGRTADDAGKEKNAA